MEDAVVENEKKPNMLGRIFNKVSEARFIAKQQAKSDLWARNGLSNPTQRNGYKMAETAVVHRDATEVVEYRLYKLVDASVVTISSEVNHKIENGPEHLRESNPDGS